MKKLKLFYHGSYKSIPLGKLSARKRRAYFDPKIEKLINDLRPKGTPNRLQCWFLVKQKVNVGYAGGFEHFIYQVRPVTKISKHHFGWISEVLRIFHQSYDKETYLNNQKYIDKCIANYWAGKYFNSSNSAGGSTWEWLVETVKVVKRVD